ncbi:uncharacterized protein LOC134788247 [Penaeus indicus]|uniref:uncharacterized protein LOC134788247 n=1 Tax=Penaeus indicus TaxID=29960 RepID=UPI00300CA367
MAAHCRRGSLPPGGRGAAAVAAAAAAIARQTRTACAAAAAGAAPGTPCGAAGGRVLLDPLPRKGRRSLEVALLFPCSASHALPADSWTAFTCLFVFTKPVRRL